MSHILRQAIGTPHQDLAVAAHVRITEHAVVRIQFVEVLVKALLGVSVLNEVVNEFVANDLS